MTFHLEGRETHKIDYIERILYVREIDSYIKILIIFNYRDGHKERRRVTGLSQEVVLRNIVKEMENLVWLE